MIGDEEGEVRAGFLGGGSTSVSADCATDCFFFFLLGVAVVVVCDMAGDGAALGAAGRDAGVESGDCGLEDGAGEAAALRSTTVPRGAATILPVARWLPSAAVAGFFFFFTGLLAAVCTSFWIPETSPFERPTVGTGRAGVERGVPLLCAGAPKNDPAVCGRVGEVGGLTAGEAIGLEKLIDRSLPSLVSSGNFGKLDILFPLLARPVLSKLTPRLPRGGVGDMTRCTGGSTLADRRTDLCEVDDKAGTGGASVAAGTWLPLDDGLVPPGEGDLNVRSVMEL